MSAREQIRPKVSALPADGTRVREASVADNARRSRVERLLVRWRPYDARRLTGRELRVEAAAALSFAAVALAMALLAPFSRPLDPLLAAALIVSLALASRVHLHLGAGFAVPTQLVLVPMLFLLPPEVVPACVGLGLAGGALLGTLRGREHPERDRHRRGRRVVRGRRRPRGHGGRRSAGRARVLGGAAAGPARPVRGRRAVGHDPRVARPRHRAGGPDPGDRSTSTRSTPA